MKLCKALRYTYDTCVGPAKGEGVPLSEKTWSSSGKLKWRPSFGTYILKDQVRDL
jgi:hypothetical protein